MDKQELERRLEAAEKQNLGFLDEIKNLKEKLAEMHDEQEIPDMPCFRSGEQWWYVETEGSLVESASIRDGKRSEFNCFHTEAYAQVFAEKCKLIAMMLHCKWYLCREYEPDWDDENAEKWQVCYEHRRNCFVAHCVYTYEPSSVLFDTIQNAKKCADWLDKHWKENTDE